MIHKNFFGGNTTKATSGINGAPIKTQRAPKTDDSPEVFKEDCMRGGEGNRFCNELGRRDYVTGMSGCEVNLLRSSDKTIYYLDPGVANRYKWLTRLLTCYITSYRRPQTLLLITA